MVFSSLTFLYLFLPLCLVFYFISPTLKLKNIVLTAFSLIFYAWGEPLVFLLLILCSAINFGAGLMIARTRRRLTRNVFFLIALIASLGMLVVFKYSGMLISTFDAITGLSIPVPQIALPIGISFYTFQCLSYTIDVYKNETPAQKSFLSFLLFVSLFPQLIAGPILRYSDLAAQLDDRTHSLKKCWYGSVRFCVGLLKKCAIANYAGEVADTLLVKSDAASLWIGILMYTFQIYFDFSGYSDMAIGLGKIFGFEYCENFNYPYISASITEFWRRWHISLGSFFRDYVYILLGGKYRHQYFNILVVWALTGIWHGASWNFMFWGLYFAVLLTIEKLVLLNLLKKLPKFVGHVYAMFAVVIGWVLFYFTDSSQLFSALKIMFGGGALTDSSLAVTLKTNALFIVIAVIASLPLIPDAVKKFLRNHRTDGEASVIELCAGTVFCLASLMLCTMLISGSSYNPFLYFRF